MSRIDPEDIFKSLLNKMKTKRSQNSLQAIHDICNEHKESGSSDFSLSTISRLGAHRGVPSERTIKNSTGLAYRTLIQAWQETTPKKQIRTPAKDHWVSEIADPRIRFLVEDIIYNNKKLEKQLIEFSKIELNIDLRESKSTTELPDLILSEWEALIQAIDHDFLKSMNWTSDDRGRVKDEKGNTIYYPGYITAIEKIISLNKN